MRSSIVWTALVCAMAIGCETDPAEGLNPSGDSDTDSDTDADTDTDTDADADADSDADTDADTDADADADTDADTDADSDIDTDVPECVDEDSDWWCAEFDCDDDDENVHPGVMEVQGDLIDNDCDGVTDEAGAESLDLDEDGYTPSEGDCDDYSIFVNPDAVEDLGPTGTGDGVDNDCDGATDELEQCDCPQVGTTAANFVQSIGLCNPNFVNSSALYSSSPSGSLGLNTIPLQGSNDCLVAQEGCEMAAISTGPVGEANPNYTDGMGGLSGSATDPQPAYQGTSPTTSATYSSCDLNQLQLNLTAPSNALGFSFDFLFASAEYNEWIGDGFNDAFYAILQAPGLNGGATTNISFDSSGNEIEVDTNFFENALYPCNEAGSGWEPATPSVSGSTGWLRTTWNIAPNTVFSLTFSIHDEGDCAYDSIAFVDNFRWSTEPVVPGTFPVE